MPKLAWTQLSTRELSNYLLSYLYAEAHGAKLPLAATEALLSGAPLPPAIAALDDTARAQQIRAWENLRPAGPVSADFIAAEAAYAARCRPALIEPAALPDFQGFKLYRGDITCMHCDAIVNAANAAMLGCFIPGHHCIDNCIHSAAGVRLRLTCAAKMQRLGRQAYTAEVIVTPGFNLPCHYVLHVTGPIVAGTVSADDIEKLSACYRNCLMQALALELHTLTFCCISTGVFAFPPAKAAHIAVTTCRKMQSTLSAHALTPIFCVFDETQQKLYQHELSL